MSKSASYVDPGTPPDSVLQQERERQRALVEPPLTPPKPTPTTEVRSVVPPPPIRPAAVEAPQRREVQIVRLVHTPDGAAGHGFTLDLHVVEVCIRDNFISLALSTGFTFRPEKPMSFVLTIGDHSYDVYFMGSEFEFPSLGIRGISFLRGKKKL